MALDPSMLRNSATGSKSWGVNASSGYTLSMAATDMASKSAYRHEGAVGSMATISSTDRSPLSLAKIVTNSTHLRRTPGIMGMALVVEGGGGDLGTQCVYNFVANELPRPTRPGRCAGWSTALVDLATAAAPDFDLG